MPRCGDLRSNLVGGRASDPGRGERTLARKLGELEARIMDLLWETKDPASVRQVLDVITSGGGDKKRAYTTVMTVLDNLFRKGWLARDLDGRAYLYRTTSSREDYVAELMRDALASSPDQTAALVRFTEQLSDSESDALRAALRKSGRRKS